MKLVGLFVVLLLCSALYCQSGKKTLVLVDDLSIATSHSLFFNSLKERGYVLDIQKADDRVSFQKWGTFLYDNLILFAPNSRDLSFDSENSNKVNSILEFIDAGGNVLIAGDITRSSNIATLAESVGVKFEEQGSYILDHFNFDQSDFEGDHSLIISDNFVNTEVFGKKPIPAVLYRGTSFTLDSDNTLVFSILTPETTSYLHLKSSIKANSKNSALVAGLQARNDARVIITGSLELFSNDFFTHKAQKVGSKGAHASGNSEFAVELTKWLFKERGLIRISNIEHHKVGETHSRDIYTVLDEFYYAITIEEWNGSKWTPYHANDVQLEFQMLDPYVRRILDSDGNGKFSTTFKIPDVYGVYSLRIDYFRVGYTSLHSKELVTVRPFRHNEYERFIPSAFPYYASAFSMMAGVALFSLIFLFQK